MNVSVSEGKMDKTLERGLLRLPKPGPRVGTAAAEPVLVLQYYPPH